MRRVSEHMVATKMLQVCNFEALEELNDCDAHGRNAERATWMSPVLSPARMEVHSPWDGS